MDNKVTLIRNDFTPDQITLIKNVIAKNATDEELQLFIYRCKMLNLDPLKPGQIYFIKYNSSSPGTIVIGIDGFRSHASSTGKLNGIKRGVIRDDKGKCIGAWAEISRKDWTHIAREEVSLSEYHTGKGNWTKMPETMIKKVAEAAALRMAFPDELGGLYTAEEMDQAIPAKTVYPEQPQPEDGVIFPDDPYVIPGGKFVKRKLTEIDAKELAHYIDYIESKIQEHPGKSKPHWWDEFISKSTQYLESLDKAEPETFWEEASDMSFVK